MNKDPLWEQIKKSVCPARSARRQRPVLSGQDRFDLARPGGCEEINQSRARKRWQALEVTPRLKSGADYTPASNAHLPPEQQQWWQALAEKKQRIDAKLDLHGLTEAQAYQELGFFMNKAATRGWRYVLIITGKGRDLQGALRTSFPKWLSSPPFSTQIQSFAHAHTRHGGLGAYYVALKPRL